MKKKSIVTLGTVMPYLDFRLGRWFESILVEEIDLDLLVIWNGDIGVDVRIRVLFRIGHSHGYVGPDLALLRKWAQESEMSIRVTRLDWLLHRPTVKATANLKS